MDLFNQVQTDFCILPGCIEDVGGEVVMGGGKGVPLPLLQTGDEELRTFALVVPGVTVVAVTQDQNLDRKERQF